MSNEFKGLVAKDARDREMFLVSMCSATCVIALALIALSHPVVDLDVWHGMALARELFRSGTFPTRDPFSYMPTVVFIHHEWGAGVISYLMVQWFGGSGLVLLKFTLGALLAVFIGLRLRMEAARWMVVVPILVLGLNMLQPGFGTVRAQMYSLVAVSALLWFLALDRRKPRWWVLVWLPIFVVWLNVHGGFVLAFGILGAEWLERMLRRQKAWHLAALSVAMLSAVMVNPYGMRYYGYLGHALTIQRPDVREWHSIWAIWPSFPASVVSLGITAVLVLYSIRVKGWRNAPGITIVLLFFGMSLFTNRLAMFYGLSIVCTLPGMLESTPLARWLGRSLRRYSGLALPITAALAIVLIIVAWQRRPWNAVVPGHSIPGVVTNLIYPVGAVEYLKQQQFSGNLMVPFAAGSYVTWKLYPAVRVSMDSRYEAAYEPDLVEQFVRAYRTGEGAAGLLSSFPHDAVLAERTSPLRQVAEADRRWRLVYADPVYVLYAGSQSSLPVHESPTPPQHGTIP